MTSKERVHAALRREPVDRTPIFMWFHPETAALLCNHLDIPAERFEEAMFNDVRQVWVGNNYAMEGVRLEEGESAVDLWGIEWTKIGPFNQITRHPLSEADTGEIGRYEFPHGGIVELCGNLRSLESASRDYFIGCDISPCLFEMYFRLRGMENALTDIVLHPQTFASMMEKSSAFGLALAAEAVGRMPLDWLWTGDDVGGQTALMMSPNDWRRAVKPHLEPIFRFAGQRGLPVAYHSCGAVRDIVPDLVDMGLDVLNPIQCNCPGMDPFELKREFGGRLTFMGGVDTQDLLPNGTERDVLCEVGKLLDGMGSGGYILAASHTIPPETPLENIFALYLAAGVTREMIMDRAADIRNTSNRRHYG